MDFKIGDKFIIKQYLTEEISCIDKDVLEKLKETSHVVEYVTNSDLRSEGWWFERDWITKIDNDSNVLVEILLEDDVEAPKYETLNSAGMDVRAWRYSLPTNLKETLDFPEDGFVLKPFERVLVKTGIKMSLPSEMECEVRSRSGLALKNGIFVLNGIGTIDADYRGDIGVILANFSNEDFVIKKGDRIAQIVFNKIEKTTLIKVDLLTSTERGEGGFGHTGKK